MTSRSAPPLPGNLPEVATIKKVAQAADKVSEDIGDMDFTGFLDPAPADENQLWARILRKLHDDGKLIGESFESKLILMAIAVDND
jgi:hypothetical protein